LQEIPVEMKGRNAKNLLNFVINNKRRKWLEKIRMYKREKRWQHKLQKLDLF